MYLILWLLLKHTSQAPPGWVWGTTREAMYLILWLLLKDISKDRPKVRALRCLLYGGPRRIPQVGTRQAMYQILWLLLKGTSQASLGTLLAMPGGPGTRSSGYYWRTPARRLRGPLQASHRGHVPDPLAIIEAPARRLRSAPRPAPGAMYVILWLLLKHTSHALPGTLQASPRGPCT